MLSVWTLLRIELMFSSQFAFSVTEMKGFVSFPLIMEFVFIYCLWLWEFFFPFSKKYMSFQNQFWMYCLYILLATLYFETDC